MLKRRVSARHTEGGSNLKAEVFAFIMRHPREQRFRLLTVIDPGRVVSLLHFARAISVYSASLGSVTVISGSDSEPELSYLTPSVTVSQLSFEADSARFDLAKDWNDPSYQEFQDKFDLALMEQVLEHLVDPRKAIANAASILKPGGFLHISVPAINNRHGEPYFYFSGFSEEILELWLQAEGFDVIDHFVWKSNKGARMYSTCDWSPLAASGPPRFFVMGLWLSLTRPARLLRMLFMRLRSSLIYPFSPLFSDWSPNSVTVSVLARKI